MELLLKLPEGKLPFIGIIFDSELKAETTNKRFLDSKAEDRFIICLEPIAGLNVRLTSDIYGTFQYSSVKFDHQKLKRWVYHVGNDKVNFGHVTRAGDTFKVARRYPENKLFVLPIDKILLFECT